MDPKDLRANAPINISVNDDNTKYAHSSTTLSTNKNKSYHEIGGKMDAAAVRPCAIIGPDRVHAQNSGDIYMKKTSTEPWTGPENIYRQPPEFPNKLLDYQPNRNISPRQTFQENMQRIMVPPTYSSIKNNDEAGLNKLSLPQEAKYCDVPYNISVTNDHKSAPNSDIPMPSVNPSFVRSAPHYRWPSGVNIRPQRHYGAPDFYQYPEYPSCVGPRTATISHQHRIHREEAQAYSERMYQEANIRFKPYPISKEKLQHARYDYNINNYSNTFHPPAFPPHKFDLSKSIPNHPYPVYHQAPLKYLDRRLHESFVDGYQRTNQQLSFNPPYHNQMIPPYGPISGNCVQSKPFSDLTPKQMGVNKLQYDANNKIYLDLDTSHKQSYPVPENIYFNDMNQHIRNEILLPNNSINMHSIPKHQLYRRENMPIKHYEYNPHYKNLDHSVNLNYSLTRLPLQYSPNSIAISPSDSNTSNDTTHTIGTSQEDCGYVSQSSTTSVRSLDTNNLLISKDIYRRQDYRVPSQLRNAMHINNMDQVSKSKIGSNKKSLDVRQFLQMWNEGEEEANEPSKEQPSNQQGNFSSSSETNSQGQLYVLGSINVPTEDLSKYEHITKISKLPENIKGYNSIEILNQYEELLESPNANKYKINPIVHKDHYSSLKRLTEKENKTFPRPVSPLDVEAKISQSVIHKEVGCNFEIKPCSPEMLNVEVATPIQSILGERLIEKVANPQIIAKSPILSQNDNSNINLKNSNKNISCELINKNYNSYPNVIKNNNYTVQDFESNSGLCLASLPQLDNDIELNFPEINQQFIKANQLESSKKSSEDLFQLSEDLNKNNPINQNTVSSQLSLASGPEKEVSKLSKYRKNKKHDTVLMENSQKETNTIMPQQRIDSVIIKNPDTIKLQENNDNTFSTDQVLSVESTENHIIEENEVLSFDTAIDFSLSKIVECQSHGCIERNNDPNFLSENFYSRDIIHEDPIAETTLLDLQIKHNNKQKTLKEDLNVDTLYSNNDSKNNPIIVTPPKSSTNDNNENVDQSVIEEVSNINHHKENNNEQEASHLIEKEDLLQTPKNVDLKPKEDIKDDIHKLSALNILSTETGMSFDDLNKNSVKQIISNEDVVDNLKEREVNNKTFISENEINSKTDFDVTEEKDALKISQKETIVEEDLDKVNNSMTLEAQDSRETYSNINKKKYETIMDIEIPLENEHGHINNKDITLLRVAQSSNKEINDVTMIEAKQIESKSEIIYNTMNRVKKMDDEDKIVQQKDIKTIIEVKDKICVAKTPESEIDVKVEIEKPEKSDVFKIDAAKVFKETQKIEGESKGTFCELEVDNKLDIQNLKDKINEDLEITNIAKEEMHQEVDIKLFKDHSVGIGDNDSLSREDCEISDIIDETSKATKTWNDNEVITVNNLLTEVKNNTEIIKEYVTNTNKTFDVTTCEKNKDSAINEINFEIGKNNYVNIPSEAITLQFAEDNISQYNTEERADKTSEKSTFTSNSNMRHLPGIDITNSTKDCQSVTTLALKLKKSSLNKSNIENVQTDILIEGTPQFNYKMDALDLSLGLLGSSQCINSRKEDVIMSKKSCNKIPKDILNTNSQADEDECSIKRLNDESKIARQVKRCPYDTNQKKDKCFGKRSYSPWIQKLISLTQGICDTQYNKVELKDKRIVDWQKDILSIHCQSSIKTKDILEMETEIEDYSEEKKITLDATKNNTDKELRESSLIQEKVEYHEILITDLKTYSKTNSEDICESPIESSPILRRNILKRSVSESAIAGYREEINTKHLGRSKRKKGNDSIIRPMISEDLCNIIQTTRRNSISTFCNEDNVYILIDNDFILTNDDSNKIYFTEMIDECGPNIEQNDSAFRDTVSNIINEPSVDEMDKISENPNSLYEIEEETWVEDVACIETVVSDDITDEIEGVTSPRKYYVDDDSCFNQSVMYCDKEHLDKIKNIYGNNMCTNDTQILQKLYMTPQMNVNKTLSDIESHNLTEQQEERNINISIENLSTKILDNIENEIVSSQNYVCEEGIKNQNENNDESVVYSCDLNNDCFVRSPKNEDSKSENKDESVIYSCDLNNDCFVHSPNNENSKSENKDESVVYSCDLNNDCFVRSPKNADSKSENKDESVVYSCDLNNDCFVRSPKNADSKSENKDESVVYSCDLNNASLVRSPKDADSNYSNSCSPEVSSTTSEDKGSSILLKITNLNGSMVSEINQNSSEVIDKVSYKLTEKNDYQNYNCSFRASRTLITKAAQKYIPPLKDSIGDLKVKLSLPQHRLHTLKQLKVSKVEPKIEISKKKIKCVDEKVKQNIFPKKLKPKFEDVLKSIDEIQFKKHKDKGKREKNDIPKVVIKKNENGAHYTSSETGPIQESYNPDLTGRKWQPWVFLEKNNFIDKMATRKKVKAIYCHRKNSYMLEEKFRKYKSIYNANFVITQPSSNSLEKGLKYTIRLKHK